MHNLTAKQMCKKIRSGEITSREATEYMLRRIEICDSKVGSYLSTYADHALENADNIDKRIASRQTVGALAGLPIAIKDNICTTFGKTSCASRILEDYQSPYNAHVIEKLIEADAVIIGKTNLDEFAMGSSTENSGLQQTRNPWDTDRVPGGSSGGSAAAMAGRLCWAALGSDTGGSIRQPAGFCGVVGLKPTYGRVSRYGLVAYGSSLDQIGPLTATVEDAALMLQVIAGHDQRDSTSISEQAAPNPDYLSRLNVPVENLTIGTVPQLNEGADPQVTSAIGEAIELYKKSGATIKEIQMPHFDYAVAAYYVIATAEASSNLARYDGVHYGHRTANPADYVEVYSKSRAEGFGAEVKRRIMLGTYALSSGYYDAYYLKALKVRTLIRSDFEKAFRDVDCIIMPVSPTTAFRIGEKTDDPLQMYLADIYTIAVNLAGVPAVSLPCGFDENSLPIGLQIIAPTFAEDRLLQIAHAYQKNTDWHTRIPDWLEESNG